MHPKSQGIAEILIGGYCTCRGVSCIIAYGDDIMTERLYYDNAYLTEFDGVVEKVSVRNGKRIAALNRSAFYPTSGG